MAPMGSGFAKAAFLQHFEKRGSDRRRGTEESSLSSSASAHSARLGGCCFFPNRLKDTFEAGIIVLG